MKFDKKKKKKKKAKELQRRACENCGRTNESDRLAHLLR